MLSYKYVKIAHFKCYQKQEREAEAEAEDVEVACICECVCRQIACQKFCRQFAVFLCYCRIFLLMYIARCLSEMFGAIFIIKFYDVFICR